MVFREARAEDIAQMQVVRNSVKENTLSDPGLVTGSNCLEYIGTRGKGWVCEAEGAIVGFAIADLEDENIRALFLRPEYEGKRIGQQLQTLMLDWYFSTGKTMPFTSTIIRPTTVLIT